MRYVFRIGFALALSLALMAGCSDENGAGGSGGTAGTGGTGGNGGIDPCEGISCDDLDFCTVDECDPTDRSCVHTQAEDGTECIDYDAGIFGFCVAGSCYESCEQLEDGTACRTERRSICVDGRCEVACKVDADCSDYADCTVEACLGSGLCSESSAVEDGTPCAGGTCQVGQCELEAAILPCTEQGIRNAIAAGGGPFTFDCDGPTTVATEAEIIIDNDVILDGEGKLTVDGAFSVSYAVTARLTEITVLGLRNEGNLTLAMSTVSHISNYGVLALMNSAVSNGSGLINHGLRAVVTLTESKVSNNSSTGIQNENAGTVTLINSTVSGNTGYRVGGIYNEGTLTLINSTVSGNTGNAGGILTYGPASLTNSTVSGNTASFYGGGILSYSLTVTLIHTTISDNTASREGSAIFVAGDPYPPYEVLLVRSLIDGECVNYQGEHRFVSNGYNIESPGNTCGFDTNKGDQFDVTAEALKLGPLQDNGGPTMTHALLPGSVAIDKIPAEDCVLTDQRGAPRPYGPACDSGAFELGAVPLPWDYQCIDDVDRDVYESLQYINHQGRILTCITAAGGVATDCVFGSTLSTPQIAGCPAEADAVLTCHPNCPPETLDALADCVTSCTAEVTGLSAECAECYGRSARCASQVCVDECVPDVYALACTQCRNQNGCNALLDACSGLLGPICQ